MPPAGSLGGCRGGAGGGRRGGGSRAQGVPGPGPGDGSAAAGLVRDLDTEDPAELAPEAIELPDVLGPGGLDEIV